MFGIGTPELLVILAVALIVIGPKKLPDLAKSLGRALGEFKRATSDLKQSIEQETGLDAVRKDFAGVKQDVLTSVDPTPPSDIQTSPTNDDASDASDAVSDAASEASPGSLESETDGDDSSPIDEDQSDAGPEGAPPQPMSNQDSGESGDGEDDEAGKPKA